MQAFRETCAYCCCFSTLRRDVKWFFVRLDSNILLCWWHHLCVWKRRSNVFNENETLTFGSYFAFSRWSSLGSAVLNILETSRFVSKCRFLIFLSRLFPFNSTIHFFFILTFNYLSMNRIEQWKFKWKSC